MKKMKITISTAIRKSHVAVILVYNFIDKVIELAGKYEPFICYDH